MQKLNVTLSPEFKSQTIKAVTAIILFITTYFILLLLALGLTVLCILGGILLISLKITFITIALGIGLASFGILILVFLTKFLFKSHRTDRSHLIEITRADQPQIFEMIEDIVQKVGTTFPKRVYLSSEVNASVFYDSNFWSMFFPVKKNLTIGLGLVNSVTQAELKAILAHEFGHFSQRSMKVGSYVYQVNQAINNMLYDNDFFEEIAYKWASFSGYFYIFVKAAIKVLQGVQWILKQLYTVVNKQYLGLSREMEFHADEVAAHITGFEPLKNSLMRISFADSAFESVFDFYNGRMQENQRSQNLFSDHGVALSILATENNLPLKNNFPQVTDSELSRYNKSKLVIKDQWASHPSTEDRVKKLEATGLQQSGLSEEPANFLFENLEKVQRRLTNQIFEPVRYSSPPELVLQDEFTKAFREKIESNTYPKIFKTYYDAKNPAYFPPGDEFAEIEAEISDLYSDEKIDWVYTARALENDLDTLEQIQKGQLKLKSFDYDGQKYTAKMSKEVAGRLQKELETINAKLDQNDLQIISYFRKLEKEGGKLEHLFLNYEQYDKNYFNFYKIYEELSKKLEFINETTSYEVIRLNFQSIKPLESTLKKEIRELMADETLAADINQPMRENFETYLSQEWIYFGNETYYNDRLGYLFQAKNDFAYLLSRGYFLRKRALLEYIASLAGIKN